MRQPMVENLKELINTLREFGYKIEIIIDEETVHNASIMIYNQDGKRVTPTLETFFYKDEKEIILNA